MTISTATVRRPRGRVVALALVAALGLAACGSSSSDSGEKPTTTTASKASKKIVATTCTAALEAGVAATDDLRTIVREHVEAFQTAIAGINAYIDGNRATFDANAATFRAYAASEPAQAGRIETAKQGADRAMKSCRDARKGDPMPKACEETATVLTAEREHLLEMLAAADALYASAEQAISAIEAGNDTAAEGAISQMNVAVSTWEAAYADDEAKFKAAEASLAACDLTTPQAESMGSVPGQ